MQKLAEKNPSGTALSRARAEKAELHNRFKTGLKAAVKPYMSSDIVLHSILTKNPEGIMDTGQIKLAEGYLRMALNKCKGTLTGIYEDIASHEEGKAIDDVKMAPLLSAEATHQGIRKQIQETANLMADIHRMEGSPEKAEATEIYFRENDLSSVPVVNQVERSGILQTLRRHELEHAELATA